MRKILWVWPVLLALAGCATVPPLPPFSDSGQWLPGKFIWRDLVTPEPAVAQKFYADLFGWEFEPLQQTGYSLIRSEGEWIGGLVDANKLGRKPQTAVWLSAISVVDVDESARRIELHGGKVLQPPVDVPGRGRTAVIEDSAGAVLRLFRTGQGDPPDREAGLHQWLWSELIADDPAQAAVFYRTGLDYAVAGAKGGDASGYRVLKQSGEERAGIMKNPFEKTRAAWIPCVNVASAKDIAEKVAQHGGQVVVAPDASRRDGTVALVLDPGGAPLVLQEWSAKTKKGGPP